MPNPRAPGFATIGIHAGARITPIYPTTSFVSAAAQHPSMIQLIDLERIPIGRSGRIWSIFERSGFRFALRKCDKTKS